MLTNKFARIGIVLAGYVFAILAAFAAVYTWDLASQVTNAQASAGMSAFGDVILFLVVLGGVAVIPTALGFYFLRSAPRLWDGFAWACLGFSILEGLVLLANALLNASGFATSPPAEVLSLARVLGSFAIPVLVVGFLILAIMAPTGRSRLLLFLSAGLEFLQGLVVLFSIFFLQKFF